MLTKVKRNINKMENWHIRLKELREYKKLSQTDLAQKMGIHLAQLNRYEKGKGATSVTGNLKYKLLDVFTKEEVDYVERGEGVLPKIQLQTGNGMQAGRDISGSQGASFSLSAAEQTLVEYFRELDKVQQKKAMMCVMNLGME